MDDLLEDDIFDRNIDQLDVRETPRWELSEEEEEGDSDVDTVNQHKGEKVAGRLAKHTLPNKTTEGIPACNLDPAIQTVFKQEQPQNGLQRHDGTAPNIGTPQSPLTRRAAGGPRSSTSTSESVKTVMSPVLLPRNLDKKKIDALVKAVYAKEGDSVKNFGAAERKKRAAVSKTFGVSVTSPTAPTDAMKKLPPWEDDDDADSLKDFTSNDRKKEERYMERTDEAIYQRATEEHIKRPPLWHDDELDSLRDFGRISGKHEIPSGMTSQQISRVPSDEELCLSPPWNDEDDSQVRNIPCVQAEEKSYDINKMVVVDRLQQVPHWHHEDDDDSTRDYALFWKSGSIENSRRPSDENIYLTPPWMEDDRESCESHSTSAHMTLEEKRAIQEEARNSVIADAGAHAQGLREEQLDRGVVPVPQIPGRDSGFCSEQDQHGQQVQVSTDVQEDKGIQEDITISSNDTASCVPSSVALPHTDLIPAEPPSQVQATRLPTTDLPIRTRLPTTDLPIRTRVPTTDLPIRTRVPTTDLPIRTDHQDIPPITSVPSQHADHVLLHPIYREPSQGTGPSAGHQGLPVNKQEKLLGCAPRNEPIDTRMYAMCATDNKGIARSISQSSLEANCYSPHDALEGLETSSVVSFASTAATRHDLDTRIDMMQSLISLLGTHDKDDMSRTLLAMSNSNDSCAAMRQSGCLPLLIDLLHGHDNPIARRDCRARAGLALHNIVYSNPEDRRGRREIRVLRLLEIVRAHCDAVLYSNLPPHPCAERWYPPLRDYGPGPAVAALMKLSFEEDHRNAICQLGGFHAIAELVEIDDKVNSGCNDSYSISLRKYAGMTLTNLTFGNTKNKTILCKMDKTIQALIAQLTTTDEEELIQVSASVLRNLSWRADDISREALREAGAVRALIETAQKVHGEPALRTLLSGLWNLSAHCPENKTDLCQAPGALRFFVKSLSYCSPTGNISVVESSGGILRNLSSHIAVRPEYRQILRENGCFHTLLGQLRSPSLRVVSNACGALWNLSARCQGDQELLWELGAVSLLKSLVNSKHKAIATASSAALRNLMTAKPTSSNATDSESVCSRNARRYRSTEGQAAKIRNSTRGYPAVHSSNPLASSQAPAKARLTVAEVPGAESPDVLVSQREYQATRQQTSSKQRDAVEHSPLARSRSDIGTKTSRRKDTGVTGAVAMDSSSVGSAASTDGRHGHLGRWSGSNDSLARHRRHRDPNRQHSRIQNNEGPGSSGGHHSRSSSDGCAVIQLLTDSYPLQVTAKTNGTIPVSPRVLPSGHHSDTVSVVSPSTARRLNQWAHEQAIESIEMSQLYICAPGERPTLPNPQVAASRESMGTSSSRHRRKHSHQFKSYRDSESEREGDIDSDDDGAVFGSKGGFANAWTTGRPARTTSKTIGKQPSNTKDTRQMLPCSCNDASNIWIKRSKSKASGVCKNCMQVSSRPVRKSRRDSSDSPLSSPNATRGLAGHDNTDPSQRGVKVTSL